MPALPWTTRGASSRTEPTSPWPRVCPSSATDQPSDSSIHAGDSPATRSGQRTRWLLAPRSAHTQDVLDLLRLGRRRQPRRVPRRPILTARSPSGSPIAWAPRNSSPCPSAALISPWTGTNSLSGSADTVPTRGRAQGLNAGSSPPTPKVPSSDSCARSRRSPPRAPPDPPNASTPHRQPDKETTHDHHQRNQHREVDRRHQDRARSQGRRSGPRHHRSRPH